MVTLRIAGEQVWTQTATTTTPVSGTFTITNLKYSLWAIHECEYLLKYNGIPTACRVI